MTKTPQTEVEEPILRSIDRWWFGYGSPTTLGLFRIVFSTLVFFNLVMLSTDWVAWFSERGFSPTFMTQTLISNLVPVYTNGPEIPRINLLGGVTNPLISGGAFALAMIATVLTVVGYRTRYSAFVAAMLLVSLHHRNMGILHGGDTVIRLGMLYLAVSPCGVACSLDRLRKLRKGEQTEPVEISLWPQRLIQFNMAVIYVTTVWAKWFGTHWIDGTATWYPARLAEFYRFPVPGFLNDFPFVYITTYGTLLVEFALGTLVFFRPLRKWVLISGVLLHGYIEYSMNIPLFSYLMFSLYISHFEGEEITAYVRSLGNRLRNRFGLEVSLPKGMKLSPEGERFLNAVDPFGFVRYVPGDADDWSAEKESGSSVNPFRGVVYRAPGAWLFGLVPGLWKRKMQRSLAPA